MAGGWQHDAVCVWCSENIHFEDFQTPDECPHCGNQLEWDWYDDPEGRGPDYFTNKPGEIKAARAARAVDG